MKKKPMISTLSYTEVIEKEEQKEYADKFYKQLEQGFRLRPEELEIASLRKEFLKFFKFTQILMWKHCYKKFLQGWNEKQIRADLKAFAENLDGVFELSFLSAKEKFDEMVKNGELIKNKEES